MNDVTSSVWCVVLRDMFLLLHVVFLSFYMSVPPHIAVTMLLSRPVPIAYIYTLFPRDVLLGGGGGGDQYSRVTMEAT